MVWRHSAPVRCSVSTSIADPVRNLGFSRRDPPGFCALPGSQAPGDAFPKLCRDARRRRRNRGRTNVSDHDDVIIIGSGAGCGTLALRLAPSGERILLLERGGWRTREPESWDVARFSSTTDTSRRTRGGMRPAKRSSRKSTILSPARRRCCSTPTAKLDNVYVVDTSFLS